LLVSDCRDACPASTVGGSLIIAGCDTGLADHLFDDGCAMSDAITACADSATNHGAFVSCTAKLANQWRHDAVITEQERSRILSCAGQAKIRTGSSSPPPPSRGSP
jgi:hypothetical protein